MSRQIEIITKEQGNAFLRENNGHIAGDLHVHSSASYDVFPAKYVSPETIVRKQKNLGLLQILTDHDTLEGTLSLNNKRFKPVMSAEIEIKPKDFTIHYIAHNITEAQFSDLEGFAKTNDIMGTFDYLKSNEIFAHYCHILWRKPGEKIALREVANYAKKFGVVEFNGSSTKEANDLTARLIDELDVAAVAGSDTHLGVFKDGKGKEQTYIGSSYVIAPGKNLEEYFENIRNKNGIKIVRSDVTLNQIFVDVHQRIKQLFDSSHEDLEKKGFSIKSGLRVIDDSITYSVKKAASTPFIKLLRHPISYIVFPVVASNALLPELKYSREAFKDWFSNNGLKEYALNSLSERYSLA